MIFFGKKLTYGDVKSDQKPSFALALDNIFFETNSLGSGMELAI